jgi:hypothetical protein
MRPPITTIREKTSVYSISQWEREEKRGVKTSFSSRTEMQTSKWGFFYRLNFSHP